MVRAAGRCRVPRAAAAIGARGSMPGRPRKSLADRKRDGDTRKIGARQHEELIALEERGRAARGAPPMPVAFQARRIPATDDPKAIERHEASEYRRRLAREHWEYLCRVLAPEQLLAVADQGVLAGLCMDFASMTAAWEAGAFDQQAKLRASYDRTANLVGLNEQARMKLPKAAKGEMTDEELALAANLPDADQLVQ